MSDYSGKHDGALARVRGAGVSVTFTLAGQGSYNEATDVTTSSADVVVTGAAVEKKGSAFQYQALGLTVGKARTLLFVPDTLGTLPSLSSTVSWGGESYAVKNVQPIAPNGDAIAATVIVSL